MKPVNPSWLKRQAEPSKTAEPQKGTVESKLERRRLGYSEFVTDPTIPQERARDLFLHAAARQESRVLRDLADEPFRLYKRLTAQADRHTLWLLGQGRGKFWISPLNPSVTPTWLPALEDTLAALDAWARAWNLTAPWCRDRALRTLLRWSRTGASGNVWAINVSMKAERLPRRPFSFTAADWDLDALEDAGWDKNLVLLIRDGWNPEAVRMNEFEKVVRIAFDAHLAAYISRAKTEADTMRLARTPNQPPDSHFDWLAKYQVSALSAERITKEAKVSRQAVMAAIRTITDLIGLELRPPTRGGRPKNP